MFKGNIMGADESIISNIELILNTCLFSFVFKVMILYVVFFFLQCLFSVVKVADLSGLSALGFPGQQWYLYLFHWASC